METESCKRQLDAVSGESEGGECADADPDNGVDNSDSDSEDLGPETAVDADDVDADRNHDPAPPTPPADTSKFLGFLFFYVLFAPQSALLKSPAGQAWHPIEIIK